MEHNVYRRTFPALQRQLSMPKVYACNGVGAERRASAPSFPSLPPLPSRASPAAVPHAGEGTRNEGNKRTEEGKRERKVEANGKEEKYRKEADRVEARTEGRLT